MIKLKFCLIFFIFSAHAESRFESISKMIVANTSERELKNLASSGRPILSGISCLTLQCLLSLSIFGRCSSNNELIAHVIVALPAGYLGFGLYQQMQHDATKRLAELHSKNNT